MSKVLLHVNDLIHQESSVFKIQTFKYLVPGTSNITVKVPGNTKVKLINTLYTPSLLVNLLFRPIFMLSSSQIEFGTTSTIFDSAA